MTLTSGFDVSKRWVFPGASLAPCQQDREMLQKQDSTQSRKSVMPLHDLKITVKLNFFQDSILPHKKARISFCPLQKLCWYFLPFAEIALIVSALCRNCVDLVIGGVMFGGLLCGQRSGRGKGVSDPAWQEPRNFVVVAASILVPQSLAGLMAAFDLWLHRTSNHNGSVLTVSVELIPTVQRDECGDLFYSLGHGHFLLLLLGLYWGTCLSWAWPLRGVWLIARGVPTQAFGKISTCCSQQQMFAPTLPCGATSSR